MERVDEKVIDMNDEDRLNCDTIDVKPRDYDFGKGYAEKWEYFEAVTCDKCGEAVIVHGENHHNDIDDTDCDGYLNSDGPMMNYYYPLPGFDMDVEDAAKAIVDLPLCIVHFEDTDEYALALTGGGMNLSWEICAAYLKLGYMPPLHFADLPKLAGGPQIGFAAGKRVLRAMEQSIKVSRNWLDGYTVRMKDMKEWVAECEVDKKKREKGRK